jgi:hypothetical protein
MTGRMSHIDSKHVVGYEVTRQFEDGMFVLRLDMFPQVDYRESVRLLKAACEAMDKEYEDILAARQRSSAESVDYRELDAV